MQARLLHTYCWFSICHNFLQLAALALTLSVLWAAGTCLPHVLSVFYMLFFSSARCARTLCHRVVGCRHERYTLAVGFSVCYYCIFFFSSLRSHPLGRVLYSPWTDLTNVADYTHTHTQYTFYSSDPAGKATSTQHYRFNEWKINVPIYQFIRKSLNYCSADQSRGVGPM